MTSSNISQKSTNEKGEYDFIHGEFSAEDAQEIISHLFNKKISFHELKCFSSEIRFGKKDQDSLDRIKALKTCMSNIQDQILKAKEENKTVRLESKIHMEFV